MCAHAASQRHFTFAFTDIEGSTLLLHELGDRYADVLAEHRRLVRDAFSRHGGVEVDTQGDAFFVALVRASDAAAAGDAQGALAGGQVPCACESVFTPASRSSRTRGTSASMCTAVRGSWVPAHGGQVRVSEATARLLDPTLELRDLCEHRATASELTRRWRVPASEDALPDEPADPADAARRPRTRARRGWRASSIASPADVDRGNHREQLGGRIGLAKLK